MTMNKSYRFSALFSDIRFWIIAFFIVRLYGITDPPIEIAHNWRQVCGNMIARNFLEIDANIFFPRLDMAGEKSGITGTEFPLLNYLIFLVAKLFGYAHWYGRLINLLVSSMGTYYFFRVISNYLNIKLAFNATVLLLASIWFAYSRKIMPDTFSVSIVIAGLYFGLEYLYKKHSYWNLILYTILVATGVLCKIPSILILSPLMLPILDANVSKKRKINIIAGSAIVMIATGLWYFFWVPHLVEEYGYWHYYMGTSITQGIHELVNYKFLIAEKFFFDAMKFSGFIIFIFGFVKLFINKEKKLATIFLLSFFLFALFIIKSGNNFPRHSYYIIPFVPFMVLVVAYGLSCIKKRWAQTVLLILIVVEGIGNQQHDFRLKSSERYKLELEEIADSISKHNDLIAINGDKNPQELYFTHRKGWTISNEDCTDTQYLNLIREKGCKYLFINKINSEKLDDLGEKVFENQNYMVFRLLK